MAKQPVDRYIMHLVWDYARYNQRRTLPDLVRPPIYMNSCFPRGGFSLSCWSIIQSSRAIQASCVLDEHCGAGW